MKHLVTKLALPSAAASDARDPETPGQGSEGQTQQRCTTEGWPIQGSQRSSITVSKQSTAPTWYCEGQVRSIRLGIYACVFAHLLHLHQTLADIDETVVSSWINSFNSFWFYHLFSVIRAPPSLPCPLQVVSINPHQPLFHFPKWFQEFPLFGLGYKQICENAVDSCQHPIFGFVMLFADEASWINSRSLLIARQSCADSSSNGHPKLHVSLISCCFVTPVAFLSNFEKCRAAVDPLFFPLQKITSSLYM